MAEIPTQIGPSGPLVGHSGSRTPGHEPGEMRVTLRPPRVRMELRLSSLLVASVGKGVASSFSRPGGNAIGITLLTMHLRDRVQETLRLCPQPASRGHVAPERSRAFRAGR